MIPAQVFLEEDIAPEVNVIYRVRDYRVRQEPEFRKLCKSYM